MFRFGSVIAALSLWVLLSQGAHGDFQDALEAYDNGRIDEAVAEWRRLADAGDSDSMVALADVVLAGWVPGSDLDEAIALFRRAAELGHPVGQLNLGDHYLRGHGLPRDPIRAFAWLSLAAEQGREWAQTRRDEVEQVLTAQELKRAQTFLEDLRLRIRGP